MKDYINIKYDEKGCAYTMVDNKIFWITNVPWIENLVKKVAEENNELSDQIMLT